MLNRDVSYQPDPTLLEEPSHVMLNHFYAQVWPTQLLCLLVCKEKDYPPPQKEIFVWRGGLISDSFGVGRREDSSGSYSFFMPSLAIAIELMMMMVAVVMMVMIGVVMLVL